GLRREREVLRIAWIDRRGDDRDGLCRQVAGYEFGHREDRRVELGQEGTQEAPDGGVRIGRVDVRSPDPACIALAGELEQRGRLWIVDENEVVRLRVEAGGVRA